MVHNMVIKMSLNNCLDCYRRYHNNVLSKYIVKTHKLDATGDVANISLLETCENQYRICKICLLLLGCYCV